MNILIVGSPIESEELLQFLDRDCVTLESHPVLPVDLKGIDVMFDFIPGKGAPFYAGYQQAGIFLFINTLTVSLAGISSRLSEHANVAGFAGLPTMINRDCLEVSFPEEGRSIVESTIQELGIPYLQVEDRLGMASPRVVAMIINEAYYTVQEGTADKADIDTGMKLGTNYPHGPFEWAEKIGLARVFELLEALFQDTHEERYKVCPLLKKEVLQNQ